MAKYRRHFPSLLSSKREIYIMIFTYPVYFTFGYTDLWNGEENNCNYPQ